MRFFEVLAQVIGLLVLERRVSYRALKRQFDLDNAYIEDLGDFLKKISLVLPPPSGGRMEGGTARLTSCAPSHSRQGIPPPDLPPLGGGLHL